ncbi:MAG: TonB-dependent receptor [Vicinamibacterales bacterium]|nr:TonB-dependent receptor [Vicinamibacterales bacterium]
MNVQTAIRSMVRVSVLMATWALLAPALAAAGPDSPAPGWTVRLEQAERAFRPLAAGDVAGLATIASGLGDLRREVEAWLRAFPAAADASVPWLEPATPIADVQALAAEVGRLRAAIRRIAQALRAGGDGAFYLGRVDVEVTAAATASPMVDLAPAGAAVLDAQMLRAHDKVGLAEALALAPGVSFSRIGNRNETSIYLRGFDVRQVPLFIDGIPVYTPYDGYADLGRFTTYDVAELRVSKGFSSVLYGPNALGGAVNVVSRRPNARIEGVAGAGVASGSSQNAYVNVGTRISRWYAQGGASMLQADTFPLSGEFPAVKTEDGGDRENAFRQDIKFNVKLGVTLRDADEYAVSVVSQRGEKGNPFYAGTDSSVRVRYWKWPYWDKDSVYLVTNTKVGANAYLRGRAYFDVYDNALYAYDDGTFTTQTRASSFKSLYHDNTNGGSIEWGAALGTTHTVKAAVHLKNDYHKEHNVGDPVQRKEGRIVSVGVEDSLTLSSRVSMVAGISADWQSTTKAEHYQSGNLIDLPMGDTRSLNPQVGVFMGVPSGMLRATVARKSRLPSIKDRYSYKLGTAIPNPDLKPERATTFEGGYQGAIGGRTTLQASVFYSRITDLIQRFYLQPNLTQQRNIGKVSSAGVEADLRVRPWRQVELAASYGYLNRDNLSDSSVPLTETPVHKGLVSLSVEPVAAIRLSAHVEFESGRQTVNEGNRLFDVPSSATANAKVTWMVGKGLSVDVSGTNLLDRNYWVAEGYPEPGRTLLAGVRWTF